MKELFVELLDEKLYRVILSSPKNRENFIKAKIQPVLIRGELCFQETAYKGNQVFHANENKDEIIERLMDRMKNDFGQCEIETQEWKATVLVSRKGKITIKKKRIQVQKKKIDISHDREKNYLLKEGESIPFLVELGVMTEEGKVVKSKYDKFRQINRFLEFVDDILPALPRNKEINIIDFGCGKSYLTFAVYYFLKVVRGYEVRITGLDLKKDVIEKCNILAKKFGYDKLRFIQGDIGTYKSDMQVDMVMTLHACDTATDYALAKAVEWKAAVILSVPCCHHEVNNQIDCPALESVLKYGLIRERVSALITDAVRANILEEQGYFVQIMEFIDMEHTPKNILIRAVRRGKKDDAGSGISDTAKFLNIHTTLQELI